MPGDYPIKPNKYLELEDLMQLQREGGPPETGAPKGKEFWGPRKKEKMLVPFESYQEDHPNPQMGFLMWLLSQLRGNMWGQNNRPDMFMDEWLQQQQNRPQMPRWRG